MTQPAPMSVVLLPHDPAWAVRAATEAERWRAAFGPALIAVHHIGSTSIPGIEAKPIIDLVPVVDDLASFDRLAAGIEAHGYQAWGEYGIPGRRFCTWANPRDGRREVHAHVFAVGSPHIARHLAFRDFMRAHPDEARAYEALKQRCRDASPEDSRAYSEAKSSWIVAAEGRAMAWWNSGGAAAPAR